MKKEKFCCPHCKTKQKLTKLITLSNFSKWNCPNCGKKNSPEKMSAVHGILGMLSTLIPVKLCLYIGMDIYI